MSVQTFPLLESKVPWPIGHADPSEAIYVWKNVEALGYSFERGQVGYNDTIRLYALLDTKDRPVFVDYDDVPDHCRRVRKCRC